MVDMADMEDMEDMADMEDTVGIWPWLPWVWLLRWIRATQWLLIPTPGLRCQLQWYLRLYQYQFYKWWRICVRIIFRLATQPKSEKSAPPLPGHFRRWRWLPK
uniref:Uncharacterized protein n=1 Tax=Rhipicephalus microplus TaxID=6941 RepID=A0A6G5AFP5_RHIMP